MIRMIAAIGKNYELGKDNALLWNFPTDTKFFRETTKGSTVIMGRLTYESIGRPLPKRRNIVITRSSDYQPDGVELASSLEQALAMCDNDCYILGGGTVYKQALPLADELILTEIEREYPDADTYFPTFDKALFNREVIDTVHENDTDFSFVRYTRK